VAIRRLESPTASHRRRPAEARPDVCTFQEAWAAPHETQTQLLAGRLGYDHHTFVDGGDREHWSNRTNGHDDVLAGFGVISRWPIRRVDFRRLDPGDRPSQGRAVVFADIETPAGSLSIFTTHLSSAWARSDLRQAQLNEVVAYVAQQLPAGHVVLTGDLNAPPMSDEVRRLTGWAEAYIPGFALVDAWEYVRPRDPGWTWTRRNALAAANREPEGRIDYILPAPAAADGKGEVLGAGLIGARPIKGVWPSDHAGVLAELRW
jgi:endonuclease/exonuclease/phosphatase family metal-dependent hydrolase